MLLAPMQQPSRAISLHMCQMTGCHQRSIFPPSPPTPRKLTEPCSGTRCWWLCNMPAPQCLSSGRRGRMLSSNASPAFHRHKHMMRTCAPLWTLWPGSPRWPPSCRTCLATKGEMGLTPPTYRYIIIPISELLINGKTFAGFLPLKTLRTCMDGAI